MATKNYFRLLRIIVIISCCLTCNTVSFSQNYLFNTEIINVKDGLPHRRTFDVVQDKQGFIWVSTPKAISKYDGYNFKTYNSTSLHIQDLYSPFLAVDAHNRLWYCNRMFSAAFSDSGIIDIEKDTTYSTAVLSKGLFNAQDVIYVGNTGQNSDAILIITRLGVVYKYDENFEEIYRFSFPLSGIPMIAEAPDGSYWVIYGENTAITQIKHGKKIKTIPFGNTSEKIHRIVTTQPEVIIETYSNPVKYWKVKGNRFVPFSIAPHAAAEIRQLFQIHQDYSCYGIRKQLFVRDTRGKLIYSFNGFEKIGNRITLNHRKTLVDRQNILWITTENGLVKISAKKNHFETLQAGNSIRGIFTDGKQLWSGGYFGNIVTRISDNKTAEYIARSHTVMAFHQDHRGHLWMGTDQHTLIEYIPDQDTYRYHEFTNEERPCIPFQNAITKTYWMGTGYGLSRFDPEHKTMTPYPLPVNVNVYINQFYQNIQGIWIVTNKGIFLMDAEKERIIKHYTITDGLPTNDINHIHEDTNGIFWLGTKDAGLVRWNRTTGEFRQFTRKDGLSNTKIYAVYEDDFQTLWLTSDYGLMAFDKNTLSTKVYLPQNGIAHEEFNTYAHFQASDGTLYFGGLNGITKFHPRDLRETDDITAPLYATRLRVLEKDTEAFANRTKNYRITQKIRLKPTDRMLELELTLLDYEKTEENQYAYKFSKDQEQWIYTSDNILSIINPPYGRYDLVIKARGRSGNWSQNPLTIPMDVKAPFYMQWWFILSMVLVATGSIIIAVRLRVVKLKKDRKRLEEEVRKRTYQIEQDKRIIEKDKQTIEEQAKALKALDKAKTHFFANITHEFRTPLTLVTGPVAQIIEEQPPNSIKKRLKGVLKNARNLAELINQLLDISKLEAREMKIEIAHGDVSHYTKELIHRFQPLAEKKHLRLYFTTNISRWKIHFDRDKWNKIIYNLLSNAIKFTEKEGSISVSLKQIWQNQQEYILLKVKDDGIGIAPEHLDHIFDRFYQSDSSSTRIQGGTGIGLSLVKELVELQEGSITVKSTVGKGTTFTIVLPVTPRNTGEETASSLYEQEFPLPVNEAELWIENEQTTDNSKQRNTGKLKLLIIEDNAEMRSYIRSCIDASLYTISEAANGEEGIAKAQKIIPDLIVSDVMMPKKDGFEVTYVIRNHTATSHIPLILLTAKASLESRLKGLERGADAYLTKPFSPRELTLRIQKLIALRTLLQQRYQNYNTPQENPAFEKEDSFIRDFKNYINQHISESSLNVESISSHFAVSRMQLHRKLKALTNTNTSHYIRSIRLEKAMELLKKRELNITEIAYETGFSSIDHFSRSFKKAYGKSPSKI